MRKTQKAIHEKKITGRSSIFSLLKPYTGMVILLVVFALLGNGINLFIPIIISRAIDGYGNCILVFSKVISEFLLAAIFILIFNYLQGLVQTYTSEKAARDLRKQVAEKISQQSYA